MGPEKGTADVPLVYANPKGPYFGQKKRQGTILRAHIRKDGASGVLGCAARRLRLLCRFGIPRVWGFSGFRV